MNTVDTFSFKKNYLKKSKNCLIIAKNEMTLNANLINAVLYYSNN